MLGLKTYLVECIHPNDSTEYLEINELTQDICNNLKQDAIVIADKISCNKKDIEAIFINNQFIIRKTIRNIAWLNEIDNSIHFDDTQIPIYRRIIPPPHETVNHVLIITEFIKIIKQEQKYCNYVEYGVRTGSSLYPISNFCDYCYGVDIVNSLSYLPENCQFYKMLTDEFSSEFLPNVKFNAAFIDADHLSESTFKDFEKIYKYIQPGGYIFLHDTYPCSSYLLNPTACNDCYKTPLKIKEIYSDIEILTFPLNPGVTIVRKHF